MAEIKVGQSAYTKIQQLSKVSLLDAVRVYPEKVAFDGQDNDEQIILFLRQHPIVLVVGLGRAFGIFLLFLLFAWTFGTFFAQMTTIHTLGFVIFIGGLALSVSTSIYEFLKWYFTVNIITSTRLIDLNFESVMDSKWSVTTLRAIQDVTYSTPGFIYALFDIANLKILTASHKEHFELPNLPKARDIQDVLMDLVENEKGNVPNDDSL